MDSHEDSDPKGVCITLKTLWALWRSPWRFFQRTLPTDSAGEDLEESFSGRELPQQNFAYWDLLGLAEWALGWTPPESWTLDWVVLSRATE